MCVVIVTLVEMSFTELYILSKILSTLFKKIIHNLISPSIIGIILQNKSILMNKTFHKKKKRQQITSVGKDID